MSREARLVGARPVIPVRDMHESLAFYQGKLGFRLVFDDSGEQGGEISYAGIRRDDVVLHLQAMVPGQDEAMPLIRIRVENIEPLYEEYAAAGVIADHAHLEAKPWGTRDFGMYDPNRAGLVFYEDL